MFKPTNRVWFSLTFIVFIVLITEISAKPVIDLFNDNSYNSVYSSVDQSDEPYYNLHSTLKKGFYYVDEGANVHARRFDHQTHSDTTSHYVHYTPVARYENLSSHHKKVAPIQLSARSDTVEDTVRSVISKPRQKSFFLKRQREISD
ncbi:uncharacterized protein [Musca autumnalis]|uniref:uncharacterized protein n=1 Tax=Musca autumnalis TaxID=221902 RepID=UPI003CEF741C